MSLHLACSVARSIARRAVLAVLVLAAVPAAALAQASLAPASAPASAPAPTEPPGYRAAIDEAVAEYAAGRYPEARALFTRAHTLQPSARTLRGLGMAEFELRNYVEATRLLQQALSSTVRALDGELRTATQALLARAQGFVGRYALALTPPELQLKVNSVPAAREPDGSLMLSIGDHALYAEAQGYVAISHTLRVNGGENTTLNITLERAPVPVAVAPVTAPVEQHGPPGPVTPTSPMQPRDDDDGGGSVFSSPWFWTVAAVVVIGAGVGVSLLVLSEEPGVEPTYGGSTKTVLVAP